jgi:aminoglycoside phosphotransferase (APT) family kinase protein
LLPSAHQIDREYRIQKALQDEAVPVARMLLYCADPAIIGTDFYVMEFLDGRIIQDAGMSAIAPPDRAALQAALFESIGALHSLDYTKLGLADYGRPANYIARQIARWRQQYESIATETLPAMTSLMDWLQSHMPQLDESTIVHGDFRLGNMMLHAQKPAITAVLDWELSTLGHPLADLGYLCMSFHIPVIPGSPYSGVADMDLAAHGLLNEAECLQIYCTRNGRAGIEDWHFYVGFSMFRSAAIAEGVYVRALRGNAADARGDDFHTMTKLMAERGWEVVNR